MSIVLNIIHVTSNNEFRKSWCIFVSNKTVFKSSIENNEIIPLVWC